jgi:hypothetical protein
MCDFSLHAVRSRPAKVGDKLTTRMFNLGTRGFSAPEDERMAVCLLPGTELSFANDVRREIKWPWTERVIGFKTAIFRQINLHNRVEIEISVLASQFLGRRIAHPPLLEIDKSLSFGR